ncbi:unnamed protein product [Coccothraustes coccothraustes]
MARAPRREQRPAGGKASDGSTPHGGSGQPKGRETGRKRASLQCRSCRDRSPRPGSQEQLWPAGLQCRPGPGHPPHHGETGKEARPQVMSASQGMNSSTLQGQYRYSHS